MPVTTRQTKMNASRNPIELDTCATKLGPAKVALHLRDKMLLTDKEILPNTNAQETEQRDNHIQSSSTTT